MCETVQNTKKKLTTSRSATATRLAARGWMEDETHPGMLTRPVRHEAEAEAEAEAGHVRVHQD